MIEVENLVKNYGNFQAIKDISFQVEKGEILGFLGPNGAGKSSTMKIITCFMPLTSGTVKVCGVDVMKDSLKARQKIGYLPESCPLYLDMTVTEYLKFVAGIKKIPTREMKKKIHAAMDSTGLDHMSHKIIGKLSKGYKQRVGLAQAIVNDPEVLILDEPTVGLDPKQIIEIRELIKNMAGKRTVILSTHILPEVSVTCQRVVIINGGKVIAEDSPKKLVNNLSNNTEIFLEIDGPKLEIEASIKKISGVLKVETKTLDNNINQYIIQSSKDKDIRRDLSSTIINHNWGLLELRKKDVSLEDIFVKLVTEEKGTGIEILDKSA